MTFTAEVMEKPSSAEGRTEQADVRKQTVIREEAIP